MLAFIRYIGKCYFALVNCVRYDEDFAKSRFLDKRTDELEMVKEIRVLRDSFEY